ncbi:MAG TPA: hypothetical protein VG943_09755 [Caulobacterales bacterium]|nr:hypothetical protein [Caulobacterales bacterium]
MSKTLVGGAAAMCALVAGCASHDDIRALRRPTLPPTYVALADRQSTLRESVAIFEIDGAPEYRLFDGAAVITTRPTRADVNHMLRDWLSAADMLAPDVRHARYLLSVSFEDLHGGDIIPFTDKHAAARVRYTLTDMHTREIMFEQTYDASMQARMPGVTPEMVRMGIASGLIGAALAPSIRDSDHSEAWSAVAGGLLGSASATDSASHDTLLWDWPEAVLETAPRVADGLGIGMVGGALAESDDAVDAGTSDRKARWIGGATGATIGFLAAAPAGRPPEHWDSTSTIGAFDGTMRRRQAVRGMMRQNFDRFLFGLDQAHLIRVRRAVTCDELNPHGYGVALISATEDAVGYDCPTPPRRR